MKGMVRSLVKRGSSRGTPSQKKPLKRAHKSRTSKKTFQVHKGKRSPKAVHKRTGLQKQSKPAKPKLKRVYVRSRTKHLQRRKLSNEKLEREFYKVESVRKGKKRVYYVRKRRFYKVQKVSPTALKRKKKTQEPGYYRVHASFDVYSEGIRLGTFPGYADFFEMKQEYLEEALEDAEYMALAIATHQYGISGLEAELITYEVKRLRYYMLDDDGRPKRQFMVLRETR